MIITSALACAIVVYKESRGASLSEQILVARVIQNRAVAHNMSVVDTVYQPNQFKSLTGLKKGLKFVSYKQLLAYYKINDVNSFAMAGLACEFAKQSDARYNYFTDKSIAPPSWTKAMRKTKTKHFNFYESRL